MSGFRGVSALFEGRHFDREVIVLCVRWYLRFKVSFRDPRGAMSARPKRSFARRSEAREWPRGPSHWTVTPPHIALCARCNTSRPKDWRTALSIPSWAGPVRPNRERNHRLAGTRPATRRTPRLCGSVV